MRPRGEPRSSDNTNDDMEIFTELNFLTISTPAVFYILWCIGHGYSDYNYRNAHLSWFPSNRESLAS